jgi:hypothetical protein
MHTDLHGFSYLNPEAMEPELSTVCVSSVLIRGERK